jgi:hypothetical protein
MPDYNTLMYVCVTDNYDSKQDARWLSTMTIAIIGIQSVM